MDGRNIVLIGFMGSGKTVVGRILAKRLGRVFVDSDEILEAEEGREIAGSLLNRVRPISAGGRRRSWPG